MNVDVLFFDFECGYFCEGVGFDLGDFVCQNCVVVLVFDQNFVVGVDLYSVCGQEIGDDFQIVWIVDFGENSFWFDDGFVFFKNVQNFFVYWCQDWNVRVVVVLVEGVGWCD